MMLDKNFLYCYYSNLCNKYMSFLFLYSIPLFIFKLNYINLLLLNFLFIIYKKLYVFCYILQRIPKKSLIISLRKIESPIIKNFRYLFFKKYFIIGLGYEVFIYKNYFFLNLGYSHFIKIEMFTSIRIYCRKKRFFIIGFNEFDFKSFLSAINRSYTFNAYKIKGLAWFKSAKVMKGRICMKQGKKKYR